MTWKLAGNSFLLVVLEEDPLRPLLSMA